MRTESNFYIPDIDGLRAVAVISVVLFHISSSLLPGGFVGVDIFFVISGFLITKIIAAEIAENRFSFKAFYIRRIRRILPVFFLVIVATLLAGRVLLLPDDLRALLTSINHALGFSANIYFSKEQGYFDLAADEKPLLHTWSLSIEEQYYFIWPVLLIGLYTVGHKIFGQEKKTSQKFALACTLLIIAAGFLFADLALKRSQANTKFYFLLQARFGELMIGSLTAMLPRIARPSILRFLSSAGLAGILLAFFILNKHVTFPGYNALLPCLGAALILYASQSREMVGGAVSGLLRLKPMVYLGLLSYSIYLWHWPILAYMRYVYGSYNLPWQWIASAVLLTLGLSWMSYHVLEKRTKRAAMTFASATIFAFAIPSILILSFSVFESKKIAARPKDEFLTNKRFTTYGIDVCHGNFEMNCVRGDFQKTPKVLMFGDSHAAALNSFIDVVGKSEHWSAKVVTASSCSPVFGFDEMALPDWARQPCINLKQYVSQNYQKYDAVFIASYWEFQLGFLEIPSDKNYLKKFKDTITEIAKTKPVYVFSDVPALPLSPLRLIHFENLSVNVSRPRSAQSIAANNLIKQVVNSVPNAYWVDITEVMQEIGRNGVHQGMPLYFDAQHLNEFGSATVGQFFTRNKRILDVPAVNR